MTSLLVHFDRDQSPPPRTDPCVHQNMEVLPAFKLEANEAIVVYKEEEISVDSAEAGILSLCLWSLVSPPAPL